MWTTNVFACRLRSAQFLWICGLPADLLHMKSCRCALTQVLFLLAGFCIHSGHRSCNHYVNIESSQSQGRCLVTQEAETARLQSGLQYKTDAKINDAISRLQHQLQTRNFTLNEEKKIVAEIDTLKRSRKDRQVTFHWS